MTAASSARSVAGALRPRHPAAAAAALWLGAGVLYLACEAVAALGFPGYSYAANYISDLGVPEAGPGPGGVPGSGSPRAWVMNAGFVLQGVLFLAAAVVLAWSIRVRGRWWLVLPAAVHAVGSILVGVVHAAPAGGASGVPQLHTTGAALAIVGGNLAVVAAALVAGRLGGRLGAPSWYRPASIATAAGGLAAATTLVTLGDGAAAPGLLERLGVYSITGWEIATAVAVLATLGWRRGASRTRPARRWPRRPAAARGR